MPPLKNPRHERFVQELVKGQSARKAYRLAGYTSDVSNNQRLKNMPSVIARYEELVGAVARRTEVTAAQIVNELATIAFANIADYVTFDDKGKPHTDIAELTREQSAAIVAYWADGDRVRVKLADKLEALAHLARIFGLYRERVEVTTPEAPEPLSDFEAARRIAFILQKAHAESGRGGQPALESFVDASAAQE